MFRKRTIVILLITIFSMGLLSSCGSQRAAGYKGKKNCNCPGGF